MKETPECNGISSTMKIITCTDMGGTCTAKISADSAEQMIAKVREHIRTSHAETAKRMNSMSIDEERRWIEDIHRKWAATPHIQPNPAEAEKMPILQPFDIRDS
jgi:predicted small metal-binding protein